MPNWEDLIELPDKPEDMEYGYMAALAKDPIYCTKETLADAIHDYSEITLVAVPDEKTYIIPGSNYETLLPVLKKRKRTYKKGIRAGFLYTALILGFMLLFNGASEGGFWADTTGKIYLLAFGILPIIDNYYELYITKRINESNFQRECREIRFSYWLNQKKVISIYISVGIIVALFILQLRYGLTDSIKLAGLTKTETGNGEYWRLLTCTLMHGSVIHIIFNGFALYIIGLMVIKISGFFHFISVFLVTALCGSIFSFLFTPAEMSVGASGGIMGLIGFILIISIKSKDIPRNILKSMVTTIIMVAIVGIAGYEMIDNAAHLGGLLGGILMALLFVKRNTPIPHSESILIKAMGIISLMVLSATAVGIAILLI